MKKCVDITQPFLVVCDDKPGGYFEPTHTTYLVNPLDVRLENVRSSTGGFYSTEDGVITGGSDERSGTSVAPQGYLELETSTEDELDEMAVWWHLEYEVGGTKHAVSFGSFKALADAQYSKNVPILGKPGWIIPRHSSLG